MLPARAALGQDKDPREVQPERPTVATHAHTVAPGFFELESGAEWDRNVGGSRTLQLPSVLKIGLASHVQLNIGQNWLRQTADGTSSSGLGDLAIGLKWRVLDDAPLLGSFALLPSVKLPTGAPSRGTGTGTTDASMTLISSNELGPVSLDVNASYTRRSGNGDDAPTSATLWTVSAGRSFTEHYGWTAEVYGYPGTSGASGQSPIVALLTGPTAQLAKRFAVDAGIIIPIRGDQPHALYAGLVYNFGNFR